MAGRKIEGLKDFQRYRRNAYNRKYRAKKRAEDLKGKRGVGIYRQKVKDETKLVDKLKWTIAEEKVKKKIKISWHEKKLASELEERSLKSRKRAMAELKAEKRKTARNKIKRKIRKADKSVLKAKKVLGKKIPKKVEKKIEKIAPATYSETAYTFVIRELLSGYIKSKLFKTFDIDGKIYSQKEVIDIGVAFDEMEHQIREEVIGREPTATIEWNFRKKYVKVFK